MPENMGERRAIELAKRDFAKLNGNNAAEDWVAQFFFNAGQRYRIYGDPRPPHEQPKDKAPLELCYQALADARHEAHEWWLEEVDEPDEARRHCEGFKMPEAREEEL